jgi:hypothetical protein
MKHARAASRHTIKGTTLTDRQSRIGGVLGFAPAARPILLSTPSSASASTVGLLRVEAVVNRRRATAMGRMQ